MFDPIGNKKKQIMKQAVRRQLAASIRTAGLPEWHAEFVESFGTEETRKNDY